METNPSSKTQNIFEEGLSRYLSTDQLTTIQSKRIAIGGAGGLGSNVAMILVRSGFKNFEILDFDSIEPSNLNRQQYFTHEIGQSKVETTKARLLQINPDLNIYIHSTKWDRTNGHQFFQNADFIVEAFDQVDFKFQFVQFYQAKTPILVSGNGMAGLTEKRPMGKRKVGNIYFIGDGTTDAACGHPPMAPRVIACAAMMAEIILDLSLNITA